MEGKSLVVGATYLFRQKGKQVPLVFVGRTFQPKGKAPANMLHFDTLDGLVTMQRRSARALSKHFDSCAIGRESCDCAARLATLSIPYNSTGEQTE